MVLGAPGDTYSMKVCLCFLFVSLFVRIGDSVFIYACLHTASLPFGSKVSRVHRLQSGDPES